MRSFHFGYFTFHPGSVKLKHLARGTLACSLFCSSFPSNPPTVKCLRAQLTPAEPGARTAPATLTRATTRARRAVSTTAVSTSALDTLYELARTEPSKQKSQIFARSHRCSPCSFPSFSRCFPTQTITLMDRTITATATAPPITALPRVTERTRRPMIATAIVIDGRIISAIFQSAGCFGAAPPGIEFTNVTRVDKQAPSSPQSCWTK